eukprot:scaffold97132_cov30-Tisochrysis_lutea.AAC.2
MAKQTAEGASKLAQPCNQRAGQSVRSIGATTWQQCVSGRRRPLPVREGAARLTRSGCKYLADCSPLTKMWSNWPYAVAKPCRKSWWTGA